MKALIIDDNEAALEGLRKYIEVCWNIPGEPLEIVCVTTLAEGLSHAHDANVTILDLELPDSTQDQTILQIGAFPPPVIVVTGYNDPLITARCMEAGAAHVFIKGNLLGFIPNFFKALAQDVVRRAEERPHEPGE